MTATVAYDRLTAEGFVIGRVGAGDGRESTRDGRHAPRTKGSARRCTPTAPRFGIRSRSPLAWRAWYRSIFVVASPMPRSFRIGHGGGWWLALCVRRAARPVGTAIPRGCPPCARRSPVTSGSHVASSLRQTMSRSRTAPSRRSTSSPGSCSSPVIVSPSKTRLPTAAAIVRVAERASSPFRSIATVWWSSLPQRIRLVYVTPSHQYPLGVSMTLQRRQALLTWADRNNAAIIEDDYDSEFRFGERPLEPLQTLDWAGRVIYVGSFSKTLLPGLRLGFMVTPSSLREAVQKAKHVTYWHTATLAQTRPCVFHRRRRLRETHPPVEPRVPRAARARC